AGPAGGAGARGGGPGPADGPTESREGRVGIEIYRKLGLVTGEDAFPVVGRFVMLRGPADSTYVGFAASMPPSALQFVRDGDLFAASYQVRLTVKAGSDTALRMNRREIVRVDRLEETRRTDEAIFFQRFFKLLPGRYEADVLVRELATRREAALTLTLDVPRFGPGGSPLSSPLVAFKAAARDVYAQPPPLIVAPRSTIELGGAQVLVVEDYSPRPSGFDVSLEIDGRSVWSDTLGWMVTENGPATGIYSYPLRRMPPGPARLRVAALDGGPTISTSVLVALSDEWVFDSFAEALDHLRYALDASELASLRDASPSERVGRWSRFWRQTDPRPQTPENEFLQEYLKRMTTANRRFVESSAPGWRTDRGRVFVQLGKADKEVVRADPRSGRTVRIEWTYESLPPSGVRIVFQDETGLGTFDLTQRSRAVLAATVRRLRERRGAGGSTPGTDG
ncbi:MAG: GWxTD domain-containing protein, partial [Gemmatimonadota bacterium]